MSAVDVSVTKNFAEVPADTLSDNDGNKNIIFTPEEWEYLMKEVNKQFDENGAVDFQRAINNARYLAKLDRSIQQEKEGNFVTFTDEEWEKFVNEQELYG